MTWTDHLGAGPTYTIDSAWMAKVEQTAQWAVDAGMYVFVNTHHEADGNGGWVTFPSTTSPPRPWRPRSRRCGRRSRRPSSRFDSRLMLECFNEPNEAGGGNTSQAQTDLNMYLEACFKAIRGTGGANATRIVMIQPVGASPIQSGIQSMQKVSLINDPNLIISLAHLLPDELRPEHDALRLGKHLRLHQHAELDRPADPGLVAHPGRSSSANGAPWVLKPRPTGRRTPWPILRT